jgi:hypothetical protein
MGIHRMGPPQNLVVALQERLQLACFVETGTFRGETAAWAAGHFPQVVTIELSPAYHAAAQSRFRGDDRVRVLAGDSKSVLAGVLADLPGSALFWLDAHWSGLDTAGRAEECPLLGEIGLINAAEHGHVVLVDDARLFAAPPPRPHCAEQWPDLAVVVAALHAGGRRYVAMHEDVLMAVPAAERAFLQAFLQEETTRANGRSAAGGWWKKLLR